MKTENIIVYVAYKENLSYNILLTLNAIKLFKLLQYKKLEIIQAPTDKNKNQNNTSTKTNFHNKKANVIRGISESKINWSEAIPIEEFDAKVEHFTN